MGNDIFGLLLMILMLENGGGTECINQLILMFLMMNSRGDNAESRTQCRNNCCRDDGFTF